MSAGRQPLGTLAELVLYLDQRVVIDIRTRLQLTSDGRTHRSSAVADLEPLRSGTSCLRLGLRGDCGYRNRRILHVPLLRSRRNHDPPSASSVIKCDYPTPQPILQPLRVKTWLGGSVGMAFEMTSNRLID